MLLLNPDSVFYAMFYPFVWNTAGKEQPGGFYPLATSKNREMTFVRDSSDSFVLMPEGGFMIEPAAYFMRSKDEKFYEGQTIFYPKLTVTIMNTLDDGRPGAIRVELDEALESKKVKIIYCDSSQFLPLKLPSIGHEIRVPQCKE